VKNAIPGINLWRRVSDPAPGRRPGSTGEACFETHPRRFARSPFGAEYSESPRWNCLERFYIRRFGMVDLPTRMRARSIARALRNIQWETMIDFGCGTGAYSFFFSRPRGVRVRGVDIDLKMVDACTELNRKLQRESLDFACTSGIFEKNHFEPESADVVLAVEVLQYLRDVQAGFREIQRVLKPGGYLIAHVPVLGYKRIPETVLFDNENIESFIRDAGLKPVSVTRVFGIAANFLSLVYSYCARSRPLTAIAFPALLLASLACGGGNPRGSYCMVVARKE